MSLLSVCCSCLHLNVSCPNITAFLVERQICQAELRNTYHLRQVIQKDTVLYQLGLSCMADEKHKWLCSHWWISSHQLQSRDSITLAECKLNCCFCDSSVVSSCPDCWSLLQKCHFPSKVSTRVPALKSVPNSRLYNLLKFAVLIIVGLSVHFTLQDVTTRHHCTTNFYITISISQPLSGSASFVSERWAKSVHTSFTKLCLTNSVEARLLLYSFWLLAPNTD